MQHEDCICKGLATLYCADHEESSKTNDDLGGGVEYSVYKDSFIRMASGDFLRRNIGSAAIKKRGATKSICSMVKGQVSSRITVIY